MLVLVVVGAVVVLLVDVVVPRAVVEVTVDGEVLVVDGASTVEEVDVLEAVVVDEVVGGAERRFWKRWTKSWSVRQCAALARSSSQYKKFVV